MVFSNVVFLFFFLPIVLFIYFIVPWKWKNSILLIFSLLFYAWGEPRYIILMIISIAMNYIFGLLVENTESINKKKTYLIFSVIANLLLLGYFKYIHFFVDIFNSIFQTKIEIELIPLPIGISFYTFQAMSYVIDVYRKEKAQKNPLNLALYVALFPQLIAGPIVRYNTIVTELKERKHTLLQFAEGSRIFIIGLAKKVLIANQVGLIADEIFSKNPNEMSISLAWIGIIAYTLQIYFDFSGYSSMAIGLGKMFGFNFPENFNYPYIAQSVTDFWRRWHMTLSTWFRDYLYIPLGGNRVSTVKIYRNILIVWTATGFWHGASWTFMAWGLYYGIIISLEKAFLSKLLSKLYRPFQHIYVLLVVMIGWVFFRADNFAYSFDYIKTLFGFNSHSFVDQSSIYYLDTYWFIFLIAFIFATPVIEFTKSKLKSYEDNFLYFLFSYGVFSFLFYRIIIDVVNSTYNPFIYFRF